MIVIDLARANALGRTMMQLHRLGERPDRPLLSVVSVGEVWSLAEQWGWGPQKRATLDNHLRQLVIVDINLPQVLGQYAAIANHTRKAGHTMGQNDMWIAATAAATGAVLLTRDKDFDHLAPAYVELVRLDASTAAIALCLTR